MHCPQCIVNVYMMKQMKREEKLPHGGGFGGGLRAKHRYPIKIMWWFTEPTCIDLFSIYIFTIPNMNRIMQDPIMKIIPFT